MPKQSLYVQNNNSNAQKGHCIIGFVHSMIALSIAIIIFAHMMIVLGVALLFVHIQ